MRRTVDECIADFKTRDLEIIKPIKSGKEATVYHVIDTLTEQEFALKQYIMMDGTNYDRFETYTKGTRIDMLRKKGYIRKNREGKRRMQHSRTKREYTMISKMYAKGARVPQMFDFVSDAILMEFIGDEMPAPRLIQCTQNTIIDFKKICTDIYQTIQSFTDAGFVHGDLSAYNILVHHNIPYVIDFPQAIDIRHHPDYKMYLDRDINNVRSFFCKHIEPEAIDAIITKTIIPNNSKNV